MPDVVVETKLLPPRSRARTLGRPRLDELLELVVAPLYFHALFATPASVEHAHRLVGRLLEVANGRGAADQQVPNGRELVAETAESVAR